MKTKLKTKNFSSFSFRFPFFNFAFSLNTGFGLIEIIVAVSVATIALSAFLQTGILSLRLLQNEKENLEAILWAEETLEAARSVRDESWIENIAPLTNAVPYHPVVQNNKWVLASGTSSPIGNRYRRSVTFGPVFRRSTDPGKDLIVPLGAGTYDDTANSRSVKAAVAWERNNWIELTTYITNFPVSLQTKSEKKIIFYEDATTDSDLANFPSNNTGNGDPAQAFTTLSSPLSVTKIELFLRRTAANPSPVYTELRQTPTGTVFATSTTVTSSIISNTALSWVEFRLPAPVTLQASTKYYIRLRSTPPSTDAWSGSQGTLNWGYLQTTQSPYAGGEARRYIGRLSNPNDTGQQLDQYDFGFRVYAEQ